MAQKKSVATEEKALVIEIPAIQLETFKLTVVGDSPLIMHKWSEKAKKEILDKQTKKASKGKEKKNPIRDYVNSMYWLDEEGNEITPPEVKDYETDEVMAKEYARVQEIAKEGHYGFPACAFKACAIDSGYQQGVIAKKTTARGAFHILEEYVPIIGVPEMQESMVKVGGMTKVADIRYRGMFRDWMATMTVQYNPNAISASQIANLMNIGGFSCGIGEWRPSRNGEYGRFHVRADK